LFDSARGDREIVHDGIYKIVVNDEVIFTNRGKCGQFPTDGAILDKLRRSAELLPGQKLTLTDVFPMAGMND
jgi:hypothetical protein